MKTYFLETVESLDNLQQNRSNSENYTRQDSVGLISIGFKMKLISIVTLTLLMLSIFSLNSLAQESQIVPDRPGFSTGTFTVPVGTYYVETGYQYSFRNGFESSNIPVLTFRTGLTAHMELFMEWDGIEANHKAGDTEVGLPSLGFKYRISESDDAEFTAIAVVNMSNDDSFQADPLLGLMWEVELRDGMGHFGGLQIESESDGSDRDWFPAFAAGIEFELAPRWNTFVEWYSMYSVNESEFFHATEIGLLFYPTPGIQLDLYGGIGISEEVPHYIGAGISFQF